MTTTIVADVWCTATERAVTPVGGHCPECGAGDHEAAFDEDARLVLAAPGLCDCCGVQPGRDHGAGCPFDPAEIEKAAARVLALTCAKDLDGASGLLRQRYLRVCERTS